MKPFLALAIALSAAAGLPAPAAATSASAIALTTPSAIGGPAALPEAKGRKGSKRTGGSKGKGKNGRYVGGRK